jgi:sacsin
LQQLNGLKLLPLADGHLQAIYAGLHTDIGRPGANSRPVEQFTDCAVYVAVSMEEQQLLQGLKQHMLHQGVGQELRQQLQAAAAAGASNVHVLTAGRLDSHVLGLLMPPEWHSSRGHVEVSWQLDPDSTVPQQEQQQPRLFEGAEAALVPAADAAAGTETHGGQAAGEQQQQQQQGEACQQPSREFIQLCWRWLADRADAADVAHWPLLPVTGGRLRLLQQPAQVRQTCCFCAARSVSLHV